MRNFKYSFKHGPLLLKDLQKPIKQGNCRLAIQFYFYKVYDLYLKPRQILCPYSYKKTGKFIITEGDDFNKNFNKLKKGDIIYAEKLNSKIKKNIYKPKDQFDNKDKWIISLHTSIYLGKNKIWHCTNITGKTDIWSLKKFNLYYFPVAVKRIL